MERTVLDAARRKEDGIQARPGGGSPSQWGLEAGALETDSKDGDTTCPQHEEWRGRARSRSLRLGGRLLQWSRPQTLEGRAGG